jgi:hypothetical protein
MKHINFLLDDKTVEIIDKDAKKINGVGHRRLFLYLNSFIQRYLRIIKTKIKMKCNTKTRLFVVAIVCIYVLGVFLVKDKMSVDSILYLKYLH